MSNVAEVAIRISAMDPREFPLRLKVEVIAERLHS